MTSRPKRSAASSSKIESSLLGLSRQEERMVHRAMYDSLKKQSRPQHKSETAASSLPSSSFKQSRLQKKLHSASSLLLCPPPKQNKVGRPQTKSSVPGFGSIQSNAADREPSNPSPSKPNKVGRPQTKPSVVPSIALFQSHTADKEPSHPSPSKPNKVGRPQTKPLVVPSNEQITQKPNLVRTRIKSKLVLNNEQITQKPNLVRTRSKPSLLKKKVILKRAAVPLIDPLVVGKRYSPMRKVPLREMLKTLEDRKTQMMDSSIPVTGSMLKRPSTTKNIKGPLKQRSNENKSIIVSSDKSTKIEPKNSTNDINKRSSENRESGSRKRKVSPRITRGRSLSKSPKRRPRTASVLARSFWLNQSATRHSTSNTESPSSRQTSISTSISKSKKLSFTNISLTSKNLSLSSPEVASLKKSPPDSDSSPRIQSPTPLLSSTKRSQPILRSRSLSSRKSSLSRTISSRKRSLAALSRTKKLVAPKKSPLTRRHTLISSTPKKLSCSSPAVVTTRKSSLSPSLKRQSVSLPSPRKLASDFVPPKKPVSTAPSNTVPRRLLKKPHYLIYHPRVQFPSTSPTKPAQNISSSQRASRALVASSKKRFPTSTPNTIPPELWLDPKGQPVKTQDFMTFLLLQNASSHLQEPRLKWFSTSPSKRKQRHFKVQTCSSLNNPNQFATCVTHEKSEKGTRVTVVKCSRLPKLVESKSDLLNSSSTDSSQEDVRKCAASVVSSSCMTQLAIDEVLSPPPVATLLNDSNLNTIAACDATSADNEQPCNEPINSQTAEVTPVPDDEACATLTDDVSMDTDTKISNQSRRSSTHAMKTRHSKLMTI